MADSGAEPLLPVSSSEHHYGEDPGSELMNKDFRLAEYTQLRVEQTERIKSRDTFVNLTVVAIGALVAFGMDKQEPITFLAIPWVSVCLGWTFIVNDLKIARLGSYLSQASNALSADYSWEQWRRGVRTNFLEHPVMGCAIQHVIFVLPSVAGCIAYPARRRTGARALEAWEIWLTALGWLFATTLSVALIATAVARRRKPPVIA